MSGNLGQTVLRKSRRGRDKMRAFDALPPELRHWMTAAALPWSAGSCLKIWGRSASVSEALNRLDRAEQTLLQAEKRRNS
ncbi:MAG: DUF6525 family protein [Pelagimonas sp.]|uniref:DUF6525 family protein n=1 Tax=Pelagimonas sp. TaxID=2073170 RepID=UPI003D6B9827